MGESPLLAVARALEALDTETLVGLYAEDFEFIDVAAGVSLTTHDELRTYFTNLFSMPGVAFNVGRTAWVADGVGVAEWVWSGIGSAGREFAVSGGSIFDFADSLIAREAIYYDPRPAFDQ